LDESAPQIAVLHLGLSLALHSRVRFAVHPWQGELSAIKEISDLFSWSVLMMLRTRVVKTYEDVPFVVVTEAVARLRAHGVVA
jgi:hypothetical protein